MLNCALSTLFGREPVAWWQPASRRLHDQLYRRVGAIMKAEFGPKKMPRIEFNVSGTETMWNSRAELPIQLVGRLPHQLSGLPHQLCALPRQHLPDFMDFCLPDEHFPSQARKAIGFEDFFALKFLFASLSEDNHQLAWHFAPPTFSEKLHPWWSYVKSRLLPLQRSDFVMMDYKSVLLVCRLGKEIGLLENIFTYSPECWYSCPVLKITYHANKLHSFPNVTQRTAYQYQAMFCLPILFAKYENIL